MQLNKRGLEIIKKWEGYHKLLPDGSCQAYLDKLVRRELRSPGYAGLWTIGYGCTEGVHEGLVWSPKQAERALLKELDKTQRALNAVLVRRGIQGALNENQYSAIVSLAYNTGVGALDKGSLFDKIENKQYDQAANVILSYRKAGGSVVKGLVNRRREERELFVAPVSKEIVKASRKMRVMDYVSKFLAATGLGGLFSWSTLQSVREFLNDNSGLIALGIGAAAVSLFTAVKLYQERLAVEDYEQGRYTPSDFSTDEAE